MLVRGLSIIIPLIYPVISDIVNRCFPTVAANGDELKGSTPHPVNNNRYPPFLAKKACFAIHLLVKQAKKSSGDWIRTNDLRVMSPTSCLCSTPHQQCI